MDKVLESMAANAPGIVGVIIVVLLFLKFQRDNISQVRDMSTACHARTKEDREAYQKQIEGVVGRQEKMAESYQEGMQKFAESIGKNGEILIRMEKALWHQHRRAGDPVEEVK